MRKPKRFRGTSYLKFENVASKRRKVKKVSEPKCEIKLPGNLKVEKKRKNKAKINENRELAQITAIIDLTCPDITENHNITELQNGKITTKGKPIEKRINQNIWSSSTYESEVDLITDNETEISIKKELEFEYREKSPGKKSKRRNKSIVADECDNELSNDGNKHICETSQQKLKFNSIVTEEEEITNIVKALNRQVFEIISSDKKHPRRLMFPTCSFTYMLDVTCFKIPLKLKMDQLNLKHPVVGKDDVCLIVNNLNQRMATDDESIIHHYENLLSINGVQAIKILPMNELKSIFNNVKMQIMLSRSYKCFLCDDKIYDDVIKFIKLPYRSKLCNPRRIRLSDEHIANDIQEIFQTTSCYHHHQKDEVLRIPVGSDKMSSKEISENIVMIISQLEKIYPEVYSNIQEIHVRIYIKGRTSSLPLNIRIENPPETAPDINTMNSNLLKLLEDATKVLSKFNNASKRLPEPERIISTTEKKLIKFLDDADKILSKFNITNTEGTKEKRQREDDDDDDDYHSPPIKQKKDLKNRKEKNVKSNNKENENNGTVTEQRPQKHNNKILYESNNNSDHVQDDLIKLLDKIKKEYWSSEEEEIESN